MLPTELEESEINPLFTTVFTRISEMVHKLIKDENERRFYKSLLVGGSTMANAVVSKCEGVKKAWSDGDEAKALDLTKLFTLLMLSQCYRWIDKTEPDSGEKQKEARQASASKVLYLFEDDSEKAIEEFLNIDTQFKYDLEHENHMTHMGILLLAKACEACGYNCIEWNRVSFPVKSMVPLTHSRAIIDSVSISNLNDIKSLWNCHAAGIQMMMKYHEEQAQP